MIKKILEKFFMVKYFRYFGILLTVSVLALSYFYFSAKAAKSKKVLNLSKRGISDLSTYTFKEGLEKLYLTDNQINDLSGLKLPSTLKVLSLAGNQITSLDNLELNQGLVRLNLISNQIKVIDSPYILVLTLYLKKYS